VVRIANFAQLVNAIAPIFTNPHGLFLQTIYHPLRLYAEHAQAIGLDVHVDGDTFDLSPARERDGRVHNVSDLGPFTLLDAAATCDEAGRAVSVMVVNRARDRDLSATLDLGGATLAPTVRVWEVNGPDVTSTNSFEAPHNVGVQERQLTVPSSSPFTYDFPAHSITVFRLDLR
jgi:alpha-N-arabinofuranosidase